MEIREVEPHIITGLYHKFRPHFDRRLTKCCTDKMLRGELVSLYLAIVDDEVVGITGIYDKDGILSGFTVVLREDRCQDIGTTLLIHRLKYYPNVTSYVWEGNIPSLKMCEKAGLTKVGEKTRGELRILIYRRL